MNTNSAGLVSLITASDSTARSQPSSEQILEDGSAMNISNYGIKLTLYTHQREGVEFILKHKAGCGNFSEMGTGKTLISIAALNELNAAGEVNKVLIVCPKSLKYTWRSEYDKSEIKWSVTIPEGHSKNKAKDIACLSGARQVLVVNYDSVSKLLPYINQWGPDVVICDEVSAIKGPRTNRTKAVKAIRCRYRWGMTGTPMVNNPLDVWSIMDWIRPGLFAPNFYAFRNRYAIIWTGAGFPMIKGFRHIDEIQHKMATCTWRKLKEECLDLPEKVYSPRLIELDPKEQKIYNDMANHMIAEIGDQEIVASTALVKLLRLQQITGGSVNQEDKVITTGGSKLNALKEMLEELEGEKVVIFFRFKEEVRRVEKMLIDADRPYVKMTGDETAMERQWAIDKFQSNDGLNTVFLGTVQAGGIGITLTQSSNMIYYSNTFSLGERLQSEDRIHRINQKNKCHYQDLICVGTIDSFIVKLLNKKISMADRITGDDLKKIAFDK